MESNLNACPWKAALARLKAPMASFPIATDLLVVLHSMARTDGSEPNGLAASLRGKRPI
jgi:hypothetical protein